MTKEEVMGVFKQMAMSQGFYGRLLNNLNNLEARGISTKRYFDQFAGCKDVVDVVMIAES